MFRRLPKEANPPPGSLVPPQGWSEILPVWRGGVVVCLATGPSLTAAQVEQVRAARADGRVAGVIAVNNNYIVAPWADVCFWCDRKWLEDFGHQHKPEFQGFAGEKCTLGCDPLHFGTPDTHVLRESGSEGLSKKPDGLCTGRHSGHMALNIAAWAAACPESPGTALLVGYDAKRGPDERKHSFGDHPDKTEPDYAAIVRNMRTAVVPAKERGLRVINCTPGSAIDCFERMDLARALALRDEGGGMRDEVTACRAPGV